MTTLTGTFLLEQQMMKDSQASTPGSLSPPSPQSPQQNNKRNLLRLRRLLHAMETNEAPSDASWRSISSRAQMAQDLWRQVQEELAAEEAQDINWLQDQVDEACQRAHQFARQRYQQEASEPDLIQTVFFAPPEVEVPRSRATSRDMDEDDPEMGLSDDEEPPSTINSTHHRRSFFAPPLAPKLSTEELQRAQREQIEEAIAQMASQMKEETQRIHATLHGQNQELNTMEDLAAQNVQKVGQVADDVKSHVRTSWGRTFATWTMLFTIFGTFIFCIMTIQIVPKRKNACLWFGCERPFLPKLATNTYSLVQSATVATTAKLKATMSAKSDSQTNEAPTVSPAQEDEPKASSPVEPTTQDFDGPTTCEISATGDCVPVFHKKAGGLFASSTENQHHDSNSEHVDGHLVEHQQDSSPAQEHVQEAECTQRSVLLSAQQGQLGELKRCLSLHPEWLNQVDENQWSAIHEASHAGWLEVVEYLVNAGASLHAVTNAGLTALELAKNVHGNDHDITRLLQDRQPQPQHHEVTPEHHATHEDHGSSHSTEQSQHEHQPLQDPETPPADVQQQQQHVQASDSQESSHSDNCAQDTFQWLAHHGNIEELQRCLSLHPDWVDTAYEHGWTALHEAARSGHADAVVHLLNSGAKADARTNHDHTPLDLAMQHHGEQHAVTQILLNHQTPQPPSATAPQVGETQSQQHHEASPGDSPSASEHAESSHNCQGDQIQWMAHHGNFQDLQRCLPLYLDFLNRADAHGWTPLHEASRAGHTQIVEYLLHNGANVDARTNLGLTALELAQQFLDKDQGVTQLLLNHRNHQQQQSTSSHITEPVEQPTEKEPNPQESNAPDQGDCLLYDFLWFASVGQLDDVKRCIARYPAYVNEADENGWTAIHEAARGGHVPVLEYLLQSGAVAKVLTNLGRSPLDLARQSQGDDHVVTRMLEIALSQQQSHP